MALVGLVAAASSPFLLLLLLLAAAAAEAAVPPIELYFSAAELARVAGYGEEQVSSVVVSGEVACELCLRPGDGLLAFELAGSKVAVTCETPGRSAPYSAHATTDEYGRFAFQLPSRLHATPSLESACSVEVLQLRPEFFACRDGGGSAPAARSYGLRLSPPSQQEDGDDDSGVRTYTTGVIRLRHGDAASHECVQEEGRRGSVRREIH